MLNEYERKRFKHLVFCLFLIQGQSSSPSKVKFIGAVNSQSLSVYKLFSLVTYNRLFQNIELRELVWKKILRPERLDFAGFRDHRLTDVDTETNT